MSDLKFFGGSRGPLLKRRDGQEAKPAMFNKGRRVALASYGRRKKGQVNAPAALQLQALTWELKRGVPTMSAPVVFLLLGGLILDCGTEAAVTFETRPSLWAAFESPQEPWAQLTVTCEARLQTVDFQLFRNGVALEPVRVGTPATQHHFLLGTVTDDNRGLYRCRSGMHGEWSPLSNLLEVTGAEPLPQPQLSAKPVPWIVPGLNATLSCGASLRGVTFLLRREGDPEFLKVSEAAQDGEATFPVHRAGNYSCSYRTHAAGNASEPSATVTIEELAAPPPPELDFSGDWARVLRPGERAHLVCVAPLSDVDFQLRRGEEQLRVPMSATSFDRVFFHLDALAPGDAGHYICRYRLRSEDAAWSADSAPLEVLRSDGSLPAPELTAHPAGPHPATGSVVRLRCRAPRAGVRWALEREDAHGRRLRALLPATDPEAVFELRDLSPADSGAYSCVYLDAAAPSAGSAPSAQLNLRVQGPLPRPQLRVLGVQPVPAGRDAILRCTGYVPGVLFELLRAGGEEAVARQAPEHTEADLELTFVGPQHADNYTCRYRTWGPAAFQSEPSDPVQLLVAGLRLQPLAAQLSKPGQHLLHDEIAKSADVQCSVASAELLVLRETGVLLFHFHLLSAGSSPGRSDADPPPSTPSAPHVRASVKGNRAVHARRSVRRGTWLRTQGVRPWSQRTSAEPRRVRIWIRGGPLPPVRRPLGRERPLDYKSQKALRRSPASEGTLRAEGSRGARTVGK
ncbi:alpha-1B-glycoprotein [Ctenodactylus gundi]